MKYNLTQVDNTLELLAAPILNKLPILRVEHIQFAQNLHNIIQELSHLSEEKPKNFFLVLFLLHRFIKANGGDEKRKNMRGDQLMGDTDLVAGDEINEDNQSMKAI